MDTEDFATDNWEELKFLESLSETISNLEKLPTEEALCEILSSTSTYLDNISIRERQSEDPEESSVFYKTADRFHYLSTVLQYRLSETKPLRTINRDKSIALLIDALTFRGSPKDKTIKTLGVWLGKGLETMERIARQYCEIKIIHGKMTGKLRKFELISLQSRELDDLLSSISQPFPTEEIEVHQAFLRLKEDLLNDPLKSLKFGKKQG